MLVPGVLGIMSRLGWEGNKIITHEVRKCKIANEVLDYYDTHFKYN